METSETAGSPWIGHDRSDDLRQVRIVLIGDDDGDATLIVDELISSGLEPDVARATNQAGAVRALHSLDGVDAVLYSYRLADFDVPAALKAVRASGAATPVIVVGGSMTEDDAAECVRLGAADYILAGDLARLPHSLAQAIGHARGEQQGREVLRNYRNLFENLPMAVLQATAEGRILHANRAAVEMFAFPDLESLVATSVFDLYVEPEERHTLLQRLNLTGYDPEFECRMKRADGSEFWFSRVVHSVTDEDGQVVVWETIGRDMSERKAADLDLAKSQEHLRSLMAAAAVAVTSMDREGRFTYAGGRLLARLGIDPAVLIGHRAVDFFPDRPEIVKLLATALQREVHTDLEIAGRKLRIRCSPFHLTLGGEVVGIRAVASDHTDRHDADVAQRDSDDVYRQLFEQSSVGISLHDIPRAGVPGVVLWNNRLGEILGIPVPPDESSWTSLFSEGERNAMLVRYEHLSAGEVGEVNERRLLSRPDGTTVWVDMSTILIRDHDQVPLRFQTMVLDVTGQIEAGKALRVSEAEGEQLVSRREVQQSALLDLTRAGLEGHPVSDFLAIAVDLVALATNTKIVSVLEVTAAGDAMIRVAAKGAPPVGEPVPFPDNFSELTDLMTENSVLTYDYHAQPELPRPQWLIDAGVTATMVVGIIGATRPFGILTAHSDLVSEFGPEDVQFMQLASTTISVTVERKRAEWQRQRLLSRLVSAQEVERKTIAEDIHDDAVQVMTAANMRLELFRKVLTDPAQVEAAQKLQETVSLAIGRLRNLLFELVPPNLERHGLVAACRAYLDQFEGEVGVKSTLRNHLHIEPAPQARILIFRIFQEALINIRKHAEAATVTVSLKSIDGGVELRIVDDGVGFAPSGADPGTGHLGLASMRERAEIAGGWWTVTTAPGQGTDLSTWVPAPDDEEAASARATLAMALG
jgi:PAS domain S-box-containing protein